MTRYSTYLVATFSLASLLALATWAFIAVIDPYGLHGRFQGDARTPSAYNQQIAAKWARLKRQSPASLLIGNSRVDVGLDPTSFPADLQPAFNFGIPGEPAYLALERLPEILRQKPNIKHIFWSLDFFDFFGSPLATPFPKADEASWLELHFSLPALRDAAQTSLLRWQNSIDTMQENGFHPPAAFHNLFLREGQFPSYRLGIKKIGARFTPQADLIVVDDKTYLINKLIQSASDIAKNHGAEITFFIHPYHRDVLALIDKNKAMDLFEIWRQQAILSVAKELKRNSSLSLWDFSGEWWLTSETPPTPEDKKNWQTYYYDPGHYTPETGKVIIASMMAKGGTHHGCERCYQITENVPLGDN